MPSYNVTTLQSFRGIALKIVALNILLLFIHPRRIAIHFSKEFADFRDLDPPKQAKSGYEQYVYLAKLAEQAERYEGTSSTLCNRVSCSDTNLS